MANETPSRIALMRRFRRMQQVELARRIGVSESTIGNWERRKVEPDFRDLVNIALVLDCELGDIVDEDRLTFSPRKRGTEAAGPAPQRRRLELPKTDWPVEWRHPDRPFRERVSKADQRFQEELERRRGQRTHD